MASALLSSTMPFGGPEHLTGDVQAYIMEKLCSHDIVFMGTTHRQPPILELMVRLTSDLQKAGVTHLALEISSDQQAAMNHFLETGRGLESIRLHAAIDCPAYRHLLSVLHGLDSKCRPRVIAIDLPEALYGGATSRDEHMARALDAILQSYPKAKILAMLGSLHALRNLPWQGRVERGHQAIRTYLSQWRSDLKIFSMVHIVNSSTEVSDFSLRLGLQPGMVAVDVGPRFHGWRLGITACLALKPSQPYELVDGVIVH